MQTTTERTLTQQVDDLFSRNVVKVNRKGRELKEKGYSYQWTERHCEAMFNPVGPEAAFLTTLRGLAAMAFEHSYHPDDGGIGADYVLGVYWQDALRAVMSLRNGDLGRRLDMGSLGDLGDDIAVAAGFSLDDIDGGF